MVTSRVDVRTIGSTEALTIRRAVLHPDRGLEDCRQPSDTRSGTAHFGAYRDCQLLGVSSLCSDSQPEMGDESSWRILDMAMSAPFRRRGVGSALLETLAAHVKEHDGDMLWCYARDTGVDFYLKRDFLAVGEMEMVVGMGSRLLMTCPIPLLDQARQRSLAQRFLAIWRPKNRASAPV